MAFRYLHDDVPSSRTLGQLTDAGERLYMRTLAITDPWGRLTGDLHKLRLVAIPSLPWDDDKLHRAVAELVRASAIDRYSTDDVWVIQIVNFDLRQPVAKMKRGPSRFPERKPSSLSPNDLALSLPFLDSTTVEPAACDLGLSNGDLQASAFEKPLEKPRSTDRETEDREDRRDSVLPTDVARAPANGLSVAHQIEGSLSRGAYSAITDADTPRRLEAIVGADTPAAIAADPSDVKSVAAQLRDADDGTINVLADLRRKGLPPAAFVSALESLRDRRARTDRPPLESDVRYVVGALKTMLRERTYERGAVA